MQDTWGSELHKDLKVNVRIFHRNLSNIELQTRISFDILIFPCHHIQIVENAVKIYKGTNPEVDSYSVFWDNKKLSDTSLNSQLKEKGITDIYVCGLAYDVCVGQLLHI